MNTVRETSSRDQFAMSKDWHAAISCVVVDIKWLRPFYCSAEMFARQIAGLVSGEHGDKSAYTSLARKQANVDYYVDMDLVSFDFDMCCRRT